MVSPTPFKQGCRLTHTGEVVFGGIDLNKFVGPLHPVDLARQSTKDEDGYYRYWINVTAISITPPGSCVSIPLTNSTFAEKFLPDTGTTLTYMPEDIFFSLLTFFPDARPVPSYGYVIDCSHLYEEGYMSFSFKGITIHVPYSQFVFQVPPIFPENKDTVCILGAIPSGSFFILGDTFLRAATGMPPTSHTRPRLTAVVLFRQEEHKVYLAQFADCGTHIRSSHGNLTNLVGNCNKEKHGHGDDPTLDGPYGSYPPPSETETAHSAAITTAGTATGFGICKVFSSAPYTPIAISTPEFEPDGPGWMKMFPTPPVQTAGSRRKKPARVSRVALTTTITLNGRPAAESARVPTATMTLPDVTLESTAVQGTTMTMVHTDDGVDPQTLYKSSTNCTTDTDSFDWTATVVTIRTTGSWSPTYGYSSSRSYGNPSHTAKGVTQVTYTLTDDSTTLVTIMTVTEEPDATFSTEPPVSDTTALTTDDDWTSWFGSVSDSATPAADTAVPTVITIPVETGETIIVKMASTSYTIVDGMTLSQDTDSTSSSYEPPSSSSYEPSETPTPLITASHTSHHYTISSGTGAPVPLGNSTGIWTHTYSNSTSRRTASTTSVNTTNTTSTDEPTDTFTALATSSPTSTTDDLDGYVTTWAWTAEDDSTTAFYLSTPISLPLPISTAVTLNRRRFTEARPAAVVEQQVVVGDVKAERCERTACLRAMMDGRNTVRAAAFCRQVEQVVPDVVPEGMPEFLQEACPGWEVIEAACRCVMGKVRII